ncbi:MAG: HAD family hydrolase [Myxococcales bacterium]|nr:HAD family hydrolase [Myxococcales bacterium]
MAQSERRSAAFFDLDRTLIDVNSGRLYARFEYRNKRISTRQLAESFLWMSLYHFSVLNIEKAFAKAVRHYHGMSEAEIAERTCEWFKSEVAERLQPGAKAVIERHRELGRPTVILTNSSDYQARIAATTWGLDDYIANEFPSDEHGLLLGTVRTPICYGPGKVTRAEEWAAEHQIDLDRSWFYTDSYSDLPMLERVGHPIVVNPDPRLRRLARRRGWPIEDWTADDEHTDVNANP